MIPIYTVIRIERSQQDNTGDPEVDFDTTYDVILFPNEATADEFVKAIPPSEDVKFYMLEPDTSHLTGS